MIFLITVGDDAVQKKNYRTTTIMQIFLPYMVLQREHSEAPDAL